MTSFPYFLSSGKELDVGEVLVRSLQNTKYSVDEKLEKSFIDLFSRKPSIFSEAHGRAEDRQEAVEQGHEIQPLGDQKFGQDSSSGESDDEDADGLESSDQYEKGNDFDNANESMQPSFLKSGLTEHVEFHDGRMRRKAIFRGDADPGDSDAVRAICINLLNWLCVFSSVSVHVKYDYPWLFRLLKMHLFLIDS